HRNRFANRAQLFADGLLELLLDDLRFKNLPAVTGGKNKNLFQRRERTTRGDFGRLDCLEGRGFGFGKSFGLQPGLGFGPSHEFGLGSALGFTGCDLGLLGFGLGRRLRFGLLKNFVSCRWTWRYGWRSRPERSRGLLRMRHRRGRGCESLS